MSADLAIRVTFTVLLIAAVPLVLGDLIPIWVVLVILALSVADSFWLRPWRHARELSAFCRAMVNRQDVLVLGGVIADTRSRPVASQIGVIDTTGEFRFWESHQRPNAIGPADAERERDEIVRLADLLRSADWVLAGKEAGRFVRRLLRDTAERDGSDIDEGIFWQAVPEDLPHWHAKNRDLPSRFPTALDATNAWSILDALRAMAMWTPRRRPAYTL